MGLVYIENLIHRKTLDIRNNQYLMRIIASAIAISRGRCGGEYHIVDPAGTLYGKVTTADSAGIDIHSSLVAAINAARYTAGTTDINYDDDHQATVIILPGDYSAEGRIAFSAKNVHVIGLGLPGTDTGVTIIPTAPSTFAFGGSGTGVELANFCIGVATAVTALYWEQMDGSCWFHDLLLAGDHTLATHGLYTEGVKSSMIENCRISGFKTSGITVAGGSERYFYDGRIINNQIGATTTCATAIYVGATITANNALIADNHVTGDNFTKTIDIDCTAADVTTARNYMYKAGEGGTSRGDVVA